MNTTKMRVGKHWMRMRRTYLPRKNSTNSSRKGRKKCRG